MFDLGWDQGEPVNVSLRVANWIDATHALNFSAGVSYSSLLRSRVSILVDP